MEVEEDDSLEPQPEPGATYQSFSDLTFGTFLSHSL